MKQYQPTPEDIEFKQWPIFKCIAGSTAYGTDTELSDIDYRTVFKLPNDHVLGFKHVEMLKGDGDHIYYELGKFVKLAAKGDVNCVNLLFMPDDCILYEDNTWKFLKQQKHWFLTKDLVKTVLRICEAMIKKNTPKSLALAVVMRSMALGFEVGDYRVRQDSVTRSLAKKLKINTLPSEELEAVRYNLENMDHERIVENCPFENHLSLDMAHEILIHARKQL